MMQKLIRFVGVAVVVLMLSACAGALATKVTSSSPRSVVVQSFKGIGDAQLVANSACEQHGRFARWVSGKEVNYFFDCVN